MIAETIQLGLRHYQAGNLQLAEKLCRQVLQEVPDHADALHLLGVLTSRMGNRAAAIEYLRLGSAYHPTDARFPGALGGIYLAQGRWDAATASFHRAVELLPASAEMHFNLGNALGRQQKWDEAAACFRRALQLKADLYQAHNSLGNIMLLQNRLEVAVVHYKEALRINPRHGEAHSNLASTLQKQGKLEETLACCQHAVRLVPESVALHNKLGQVLQQLGKLAEAADVYADLGSALQIQGKWEEASNCLEQAQRLWQSPRLYLLRAFVLPAIYQSDADLESSRRRLIDAIQELQQRQVVLDLTNNLVVPLFYLSYQGRNDREIHQQVQHFYKAPDDGGVKPAPSEPGQRKIRIGFLSAFFRVHSVGHWMRGLVAHLSREAFDVTVLAVDSRADKVASFFKQHADRYVEVPRDLAVARRLIAEQQLDVLLYTDIGTDLVTQTLAYSRLAPVQCTTLGHPVTSGIKTIDYFISAETLETDDAQEHYTETLVRLKTIPIYFYRPKPRPPFKSREDFGLAGANHLYACMQTLFKFHPEFDAILGGILRGDPRGILVLNRGKDPYKERILRQRFSVTLPDVMDRICFLPFLEYQDYLNVLALSDVMLDPCHFGGGTTAFEGLAVGTPIVTMPSQLLRGRITYGLYKQMGFLDCVAANLQEYVDIALRLGTNPSYREMVRQKIMATNGVLFENAEGVRELERFLLRAVEAAWLGQTTPQ